MLDTKEIVKLMRLMKKSSTNQKLVLIRDLSKRIEQDLEKCDLK